MKVSRNHRIHLVGTVVLGLSLAVWLILPGLASRIVQAGSGVASTPAPKKFEVSQDRQAALKTLSLRLKSGEPFSSEEADILNKYTGGGSITDLEADTVISRVLYKFYILADDLTAEQENLLDRYLDFISPRKVNLADLKKRIAARDAKAPPRAPQVAPSNDLCAGAEVVPPAGPFPYLTAVTADITDATTVGDPPIASCTFQGGPVSRSIWYTFTPSTTAAYNITSCADAPTSTTLDDTVIGIYTSAGGCAGPFTEIPTGGGSDGCDDDTCITEALQSVLTTNLTAGTTYYIVVWKFDTPAPTAGNTAVQLRINQVVSPVNETCAGAIPLTLNTAVSGTTNAVTTNDYQLTGTTCFTGIGQTSSTAVGRDVVYSFTAPAVGNYSFTINFASGFNGVLYVSTSCPTAPPTQTLTCNNVSGPVIAAANRNTNTSNASESVQCLALTAGQQVFVFVDEVALSAAGGSFIIKVTQCASASGNETEPNDTPAQANALVCGAQGGIVPAGDVDFYTLGTPAAGSRVFAMADGISASSADFDIRITSTTDTLEYDDANLDSPFGTLAPIAAGTPLTGVASFIRMSHFTAGTQSEPYRLFSVVQPPGAGLGGSSATAEAEPNDTVAAANSATNNFFSGLAGSAGDVDMFCFNATAGDVVFIALDTDPLRNNTPFNGALALLNSTGALLVSVNDGGTTSSTTTGAGSLTSNTPNSPAEGIVFTIQTTGNYIARVTVGGGAVSATSDYLLSISKNCALGGGGCGAACSSITCPANVTQPNAPNQCGAVVNYPAPTANGSCGTITCSPASGSFFPVGTTTVTCTSSAGPTCTFTVTVQDTQPPSITCPANVTVSNDPNQCGAVVNYPAPTITDNCPGTFTATCTPPSGSFFPVGTTTVTCEVDGFAAPVGAAPNGQPGCTTITHSASQTITLFNSVSCNNGAAGGFEHTNNSYWRAFSLPAFGINGAFDVMSVEFGVEEATSGAANAAQGSTKGSKTKGASTSLLSSNGKPKVPAGAGQPVTIRLYTSNQAFPTGFPGSLTQIGTTSITLPDQTLTVVNIPVTGTAPAGSQLVVEIFTPDGQAAGNSFFIGSNTAAETGPSYLSAAACGVASPTTTAALGVPNMHTVMNVNGCEQATGGGPSCTFTVTVNDTQPPVITCPPNQTAVTATVSDPCVVVNFTTTASDNCPGVVVVCNPPSGSCFPVGVTTVTCTATDTAGNTATCMFTVSVFNGRLQDDSEGCNNTVLFNTLTGDYRWCCHGTIFVGRGKVTKLGNTYKIEHNAVDRRVLINLSAGSFPPSGNASLQSPPGTIRCVIQDRDTRNDTCVCGAPAPTQ